MPKHKLKTDHFLIILAITLAIFLTLLLLVFFIFTSGKSQSTNTPSSSITKTAANSKYKYEYHSSELTAQFVSKDGNPKVLLTSIDLESIEMEIVRSEQRNKPTYSVIKSENNEDTFLMKEVLPNVDLEYTPLLQGVKENIVVKSLPKTPPEFTFKINSLNLSLKYFDKDGEYWFVDAKDIKKYQILPPYMTDNTGNVSYSVLYRHPQVDDPNFENNINYLEVIPDYEWLTSAERNYPVRIDPTVIKGSAPISIWNIDEGNGTTIGDNSTNGNNLTITNATWQNNDAQSSNYIGAKHVRFDGSGDYLSRTYDADFDFGTGSFSIGMWARIPNSAAGPDILLARYSGAGFKVYMDSNEYICFGIDDDSTWGPDDSACTTTAYNDSTWHHIEVVKSSTTSITLYVDGKAVATNSSTGADSTISGSSPVLYVGIDSDGSSNSFQGDIDQITVYNYARDAYQVKADALTKPQVTVSFGQSKNTLQDGLFGYWKFDENTGTSANDSSGNIHTMTLNTAAWTNGKYGPGWNGNGTRYVLLTDDADFDFAANQNFTITGWFKTNSATNPGSDEHLFSKRPVNQLGYEINITSSGFVTFGIDDDGTSFPEDSVTSATDVYDNQWHFYTAVKEGTDRITLYIDGNLIQTDNSISANGTLVNSADIEIGNGNAQNAFNGVIDEVRTYNRALSPYEVRTLYNYAPGPVAYWKFDENTGTSGYDSSGNANTGSFVNTPLWDQGKYGSSLRFNGSNTYLTVPDSSTVEFGTGSFTASAWFKYNGTATTQDYILHKWETGVAGGYALNIQNVGTLRFGIEDDGSSFPEDSATSTARYDDGKWHYVTGVKTGTSKIELFVDGVLVATDASVSSTATLDNANTLKLGARYDGTQQFDGWIDDIKLYNYARTQSQIVEDMNGGHPLGGGPVGSQIGYWKFDEMNGDITNDSSPLDIDGNLSGSTTCPSATICPTWSLDGKYGSALYFGGLQTADGDSHVRLTNDTYDVYSEGSISLWFKPDDAGDNVQQLFASAEDDNNTYTDHLSLQIDNTSNSISYGIINNGSLALATNAVTISNYTNWHHVVLNMSAAGNELYIDGVKQSVTYSTGNASTNVWFDDIAENTTAYTIGCVNADASDTNECDDTELFQGYMDEVKIYSAPLTTDQVRIDYNNGMAAVMGSTSVYANASPTPTIFATNSMSQSFCVPGDTTTCTPPVGYWPLDENTGTTSKDMSGNANNLTLANSVPWGQGILGSGLQFINNNHDVTASSNVALHLYSDMSVSFWMNSSTIEDGDFIATIRGGGETEPDNESFVLEWDTASGNDIQYQHENGAGVNNTNKFDTNLSANTWYNIQFVRDVTANTVILYVNGIKTGATYSYTNDPTCTSCAANLKLGLSSTSSTNSRFQGVIDDLRIYNYARTPAQVVWDYNRGKPFAWYRLDDCSGTTINDASGNGITGTLTIGGSGTQTATGTCSGTAGAWLNGATGKINSSINLDGTDDYISITNAASIDQNDNLASGMSVSAWIYANGAGEGNGGRIFTKNTNTWCRTDTTSGGKVDIECSMDLGTDATLNLSQAVTTGEWHHVVVTWSDDSDDELTIYIDGTNRGSSTNGVGPTSADTANLILGNDTSSATQTFDGQIDDMQIFNYELNAQQIKVIYNNGAASFR